MHTGQPQCDWVSFLIECDHDLFQKHYLEEWNMLLVATLPAWAQSKQTRVHSLGAVTGGKRRYVFSIWGESAEQVRRLPFAKWFDNITRYDVKRRLYDIKPDTYERLCVALQFADTRRNVEAFKLPKRHKNTQRDSGGEGVRFGSRKSDVCTKLSKRGKEVPYFETQIQDDALNRIVLDVFMDAEETGNHNNSWSNVLERCGNLQMRHIQAWLFASGIDKPIDGLRHEDIPMPEKLKKMFQLELWSGGAPLPTPLQDYADGFDEVIDC